jgi:hypothetical protein
VPLAHIIATITLPNLFLLEMNSRLDVLVTQFFQKKRNPNIGSSLLSIFHSLSSSLVHTSVQINTLIQRSMEDAFLPFHEISDPKLEKPFSQEEGSQWLQDMAQAAREHRLLCTVNLVTAVGWKGLMH